MRLGPTEILDEHAEAFSARYARLIVTAIDRHWVDAAASAATGYAASVVGCDCEAGVERYLKASETPDGRPGAALLFFNFRTEQLAKAIAWRVGECVLTCPTTACFNGLSDAEEVIPLGGDTREFADGFEEQGTIADCESSSNPKSAIRNPKLPLWKLPVWDGEFLVDAVAGVGLGVAGGNLVIHADSQATALGSAVRAVEAVAPLAGVITPFPGGVCRAGSKVGGTTRQDIVATIDEAYCPTLSDRVTTQLVAGAESAYEIIINGIDLETVRGAMRAAIEAAAGEGVLAIGARSFGGKLGKHRIGLREVLELK
ncbi:MAG: formylmethanofuran--tetrahydromethanopterin N-formyltransferase [Pirellulales bacterium]